MIKAADSHELLGGEKIIQQFTERALYAVVEADRNNTERKEASVCLTNWRLIFVQKKNEVMQVLHVLMSEWLLCADG